MSRAIFVALLLLAATACRAQEPVNAPFLAVQGRSEMRVVPDLFPLYITIQDKSIEPAKAQQAVEAAARLVLERARALGLQDSDIELGNVEVRPDTRYDNATGKETFLGTNYSRRIGLRFHTLAGLKKFIEGTPEDKLLRLDTGEFALEDTDRARRALFIAALANAREAAEVAAKAIGKRVIGVQTASDQPLALSRGAFIVNAIDVASVESTAILTSAQIARLPMARGITSVALIADPNAPRTTEIALSEGVVRLTGVAFVVYLIGD